MLITHSTTIATKSDISHPLKEFNAPQKHFNLQVTHLFCCKLPAALFLRHLDIYPQILIACRCYKCLNARTKPQPTARVTDFLVWLVLFPLCLPFSNPIWPIDKITVTSVYLLSIFFFLFFINLHTQLTAASWKCVRKVASLLFAEAVSFPLTVKPV